MTRETRIALLVGLAFIVLFGYVLSRNHFGTPEPTQAAAPSHPITVDPEVEIAVVTDGVEASALGHQGYKPPNPPGAGDGHPTVAGTTGRPPINDRDRSMVADSTGGRTLPPLPPTDRIGSVFPRPTFDGTARSLGITPTSTFVAPPPPLPAGYKYVVKQGDTIPKITRELYGKEYFSIVQKIVDANKDKDPNRLKLGAVLIIPEIAGRTPKLVGATPPPATGLPPAGPAAGGPIPGPGSIAVGPGIGKPVGNVKIYVVRPGDNLGQIAIHEMGTCRGGTVEKILKANADKLRNPGDLKAGMKLKIPVTE